MSPLDPKTDRLVWALAEHISELPVREQVWATTVAIAALLGEQTPENVDLVCAAGAKLVREYQASDSFRAAVAKRPS